MKNKRMTLATAFILSTSAGMASAGQITFEEGGLQSCCFESQEPLDTEYVYQGVIFGGGWEILHQSGGFGLAPRSGEHFAAYDSFDTDLGISDTLTLTFAGVATFASGYLGDSGSSSWTVTTRYKGDLVAELNLTNPAGSYKYFSFGPSLFDELSIRGHDTTAVVDDLEFDLVQVSAPSTLGMLSLAIAGLSTRLRRAHAIC